MLEKLLSSYSKNPEKIKTKMMEEQTNSVIELANRPEGVPDENTFRFRDTPMPDSRARRGITEEPICICRSGIRGFMDDTDSYLSSFWGWRVL